MKKKIMVFILLFAFLVGVLVPAAAPVPVQAANSTETTADDVKYADIEDFMHGMGYTEFVMYDGYLYIVFLSDEYLQVVSFYGIEDCLPLFVYSPGATNNSNVLVVANKDNRNFYVDRFYSPVQASMKSDYGLIQRWSDSSYIQLNYNLQSVTGVHLNYLNVPGLLFSNLVYSDLDFFYFGDAAYNFISGDGKIVFESTKYDSFSFPVWCQYAGLNCLASSNESPTKIPYSYNDYWHIVRRTSSGKWLLTTIGNSKNQEGMQVRLSENNGSLIIYNDYQDDGTDSSVNGYLANVRQYEYDTDGWKVRSYDTYDFSETEEVTIELEAGTGLDDTRLLAYTNTDIYSFNGYAILHEASTEYYEVTDTPTVTPEPTPGSGSSGSDDSGSSGSGSSGGSSSGSGGTVVGGDAKPGGMLDFLVTLATLVWTELFAVEVPVDGYMISFQQIVIYGAVVGMLIWGGCKLFGKKG